MSEGLQSALASGFLQSQDGLLKFEGQRALCGSSKAHLAKRTCLLNITTHIPKDTLKGSQKSTQSGATLSFKAQEILCQYGIHALGRLLTKGVYEQQVHGGMYSQHKCTGHHLWPDNLLGL